MSEKENVESSAPWGLARSALLVQGSPYFTLGFPTSSGWVLRTAISLGSVPVVSGAGDVSSGALTVLRGQT